mmetsp:Transcript_18225/g.46647  ORF Transcript_18225/g.46647 Transcript_18225/m.46647 type:complete len:285 (+) Transcript_18225:576-1430(+)
MVRYAGNDSLKLSQSIIPAGPIISAPTMMSAGAVAVGGTAEKTGMKKTDTANQHAITMAVSPVRPPSAMPAQDSLAMITGEVPRTEPAIVAKAEARKAYVEPGSLCVMGSTRPACRPAPNCTPAVSKSATKRKASVIGTVSCQRARYSVKLKWQKVPSSVGAAKTDSGSGCSPKTHEMHDEVTTPISMAPCTRCTVSTAMSKVVATPSRTYGLATLPNATSVSSLGTTRPVMRKPMKAWKSPMPTVMACFRLCGMMCWMNSEAPQTVSNAKSTPWTRQHVRATS